MKFMDWKWFGLFMSEIRSGLVESLWLFMKFMAREWLGLFMSEIKSGWV